MKPLRIICGVIVGLALIFAVLAGGRLYNRWQEHREEQQVAHLSPSLDEFLAIASRSDGGMVGKPNGLPNPKPVLICAQANSNKTASGLWRRSSVIDPLTARLPQHLLPNSPSEVHVVVALHWGEIMIGTYNDGSAGYQETCRVEVWDRRTRSLVDRKEFTGGMPPETTVRVRVRGVKTERKENVFGKRCDDEILDYLNVLFK